MRHEQPHPMTGKTAKIKPTATHFQVPSFGGSELRIEDWWDRAAGKSWKVCEGNPACLVYAVRSAGNRIPPDDEVVYGKIGSFGHLVHVSELEQPQPEAA